TNCADAMSNTMRCLKGFLSSWKPINGGNQCRKSHPSGINTERRRIAWKSRSSITKKKSERKDLMKHLLRWLEGSPGLARANQKKAKKDKLPKTPWKETKLPVGGD